MTKKVVPVNIKSEVSDVTNPIQRKKAPKRISHSNFIFTVNTNQRYGPYEEGLEEFSEQLRACMEDIFCNLHDYVIILEPDHKWSTKYIKKGDCDSVVERSENNDTVHAHVFVGLSHYTKVKLNIQALRNKICEDMNLKDIYMSRIKALRKTADSDLERWKEYSHKNNLRLK
jgi:hypothetical protein